MHLKLRLAYGTVLVFVVYCPYKYNIDIYLEGGPTWADFSDVTPLDSMTSLRNLKEPEAPKPAEAVDAGCVLVTNPFSDRYIVAEPILTRTPGHLRLWVIGGEAGNLVTTKLSVLPGLPSY